MKFTLIFIFDPSLMNVLLVEKNRGYYIGKLNGVGGKIEPSDASVEESAYRELLEETGIRSDDLNVFKWLTTMNYPSGHELNVFYGVLKEGRTYKQVEDEILYWYPVNETKIINNSLFAGESVVSYLVNAALINYQELKENAFEKSC